MYKTKFNGMYGTWWLFLVLRLNKTLIYATSTSNLEHNLVRFMALIL